MIIGQLLTNTVNSRFRASSYSADSDLTLDIVATKLVLEARLDLALHISLA